MVDTGRLLELAKACRMEIAYGDPFLLANVVADEIMHSLGYRFRKEPGKAGEWVLTA